MISLLIFEIVSQLPRTHFIIKKNVNVAATDDMEFNPLCQPPLFYAINQDIFFISSTTVHFTD